MSEAPEVGWTLLEQLLKLGKQLSDEEGDRVVARESKLALLSTGQQIIDVSPALTVALRLIEQLPPEAQRLLEQRRAKLVVLSPGQQVVEKTPAVVAALKVVDQLSEVELLDVAEKRARIAFLPKGAKIDYAFDPKEVGFQVSQLRDVAEIVGFLDSDSRLGLPNLKKVATALGITVPPSAKAKPAVQLLIAQAVIHDRGDFGPELPDLETFDEGAVEGRRHRGRRVAPWDPFPVYIEHGENTLRDRLYTLDLEQLRDIVADHGMDTARLAMKWQDRERLVDLIVGRVRDRASKGHAFRPPAQLDVG